jgi:hypothetical protein
MNELLTVEIDSKNYDSLIDLLNESNLIVEILPRATQTVVRTKEPIDVVCLTTDYNSMAEDMKITTKRPTSEGIAGPGVSFNYSISETV